ncbi:MAG: MBL fold metallo-hydrolase [Methanobacteriota archaeon]|nr:MAG: MBL fold metallo-hydrolase [Euryarchaeota archaeon]
MIPSASIILKARDGKLLMMRRSPKMRAFPNSWVFPGGKLETSVEPGYTGEEEEFKIQALQELWEEVGIVPTVGTPTAERSSNVKDLIPEEKLREVLNGMKFIGRRQTPPFSKRVFDAAYFLLKVDEAYTPIPDGTEAVEAKWAHPKDMIESFRTGKAIIPPPVLRLLKLFNGDEKEAIAKSLEDQSKPVGLQTPVEFAEGLEHIPLRSYTAKPFQYTNLTIFRGDEATLLVDPGWNEEASNARPLLETIKTENVIVFLTHHHKDHIAGLDLVAEMFPDATVIGSRFTLERVTTDLKKTAVDELMLDLVEEGEGWVLHILPAPGHTKGHLVIYDMRNDLLVAGDHVVGIGTALLDPTSGSMSDYLRTTDKLIELNPRLILPAHGPVIFEPQKRLQYYKRHRLEREEQVINSLRAGNSTVKEIVADIYREVDQNLWRYAGFNVFLHLQKLKEEGRVQAMEQVNHENYEHVKFQLVNTR